MPNLLFVTSEVVAKLRTHPAYQFWNPILSIFPIRPIPLDERKFLPRKVTVKDGYLYITTDMKFVYCRDGLCSFVYEDQELSFRLSPKKGILETVDGNQFAGVLGRVAEVASSSDVRLLDTDKAYHPFFDQGLLDISSGGVAVEDVDAGGRGGATGSGSKAKSRSAGKSGGKAKSSRKTKKAKDKDKKGLVLGKYERDVCQELVDFHKTSRKSFKYLSKRFGIPLSDVKAISAEVEPSPGAVSKGSQDSAKSSTKAKSTRKKGTGVSKDVKDEVIRMKKVSKKSFAHIAKRFNLSVDEVKEICS